MCSPFTLAPLQMVFVVKPVPKAATHAATRLPIVDQIVDMVRGGAAAWAESQVPAAQSHLGPASCTLVQCTWCAVVQPQLTHPPACACLKIHLPTPTARSATS